MPDVSNICLDLEVEGQHIRLEDVELTLIATTRIPDSYVYPCLAAKSRGGSQCEISYLLRCGWDRADSSKRRVLRSRCMWGSPTQGRAVVPCS